MGKCGCRIVENRALDLTPFSEIIYCPLHDASPDLLEAAKTAVVHLRACENDEIIHPFKSASLPLLEHAIAKAEKFVDRPEPIDPRSRTNKFDQS